MVFLSAVTQPEPLGGRARVAGRAGPHVIPHPPLQPWPARGPAVAMGPRRQLLAEVGEKRSHGPSATFL